MADPTRARFATLTCYIAFIGLGIAGTIIGPTFQSLTARFEIPLDQAGIFTSLQSLGVFAAVLVVGRLLDRVNARFMLTGGSLLMGSGLLILGAAQTLPAALAGAALIGVGYGALNVSPNTVIAALNPDRAGAALNLLNVFYGVGAVLGPQVVNFALSQRNFTLAYSATAVFALLLAAPFWFVSVRVRPKYAGEKTRTRINWIALAPFALVLFMQVGAEVGYGNWIFTHMSVAAGSTEGVAAFTTSLFWAGLTVGRIVAVVLLRRLSNAQILVISAVILLVGVGLIVLLPSAQLAGIVSAFMAGFGIGPLFPTALALATERYPQARGTVGGTLIAIGITGAIILPWLQGQVGGGRSGGMIVVLASTAALLVVTFGLLRSGAHKPWAASQSEVQGTIDRYG